MVLRFFIKFGLIFLPDGKITKRNVGTFLNEIHSKYFSMLEQKAHFRNIKFFWKSTSNYLTCLQKEDKTGSENSSYILFEDGEMVDFINFDNILEFFKSGENRLFLALESRSSQSSSKVEKIGSFQPSKVALHKHNHKL